MGITLAIVMALNVSWLGLAVMSFVRPGRWAFTWGIAGLAAAGGTPLAAGAITFLFILRALSETARVAPADKATVLANGISEAMNCAAVGLVGSLPLWALAIVLVVRGSRLRRASAG